MYRLVTTTLFCASLASALERCDPIKSVKDYLGPGYGDRLVALTIDSSQAMFKFTQPDNHAVAKNITEHLLESDLVTVIDFSGEGDAKTLYPLGPVSGAAAAVDKAQERSKTYIGGGIRASVDQLSKAGSTKLAGRGAIILASEAVDGDNKLERSVAEIRMAGEKGIRVHLAYPALWLSSDMIDMPIVDAVISTGGVVAHIEESDDVYRFIAYALATGLTKKDAVAAKGSMLIPELRTASTVDGVNPTIFQYFVRKKEFFSVTIGAFKQGLNLTGVLKDANGTELQRGIADKFGRVFLNHTSDADKIVTFEINNNTRISGDRNAFSVMVDSKHTCGGLSNTTGLEAGAVVRAGSQPVATVNSTPMKGAGAKVLGSLTMASAIIPGALLSLAALFMTG